MPLLVWPSVGRSLDNGRPENHLMEPTPGKVILKWMPAIGLLCSAGLSAACLVFSENQACNNADSLMLPIISTQSWTPYFWGTNRYGMLLPLIASPISNLFTNLILQNMLSVSLCLVLPMLTARFVLRNPLWPAIGALVSAFFIGLFPSCFVFLLFTSQCYYPALALCFSGLLLFCSRSGRTAPKDTVLTLAGVILVLLSFWMTPTLLLTVLPIVVVRECAPQVFSTVRESVFLKEGVIGRLKRLSSVVFHGFSHQCVGMVVLLCVAFAFSLLLARLSVYQTGYHFLPPTRWPTGWLALMRNVVVDFLPSFTIRFLLIAFSGIGFMFWTSRRHTPEGRTISFAFLAVIMAVASETLVAGANAWVMTNGYAGRYLSISIMLIVVICVGAPLAILPPDTIRRHLGLINALALALLLLVSAIRFGLPSMLAARESLDRACGKYSSDIVKSGCTHFAGNYWKVWPSVFHANLILQEKSMRRTVWGISFRCEDSRVRWPTESGSAYLIGIAKDDEEGPWAMTKEGIAAQRTGELGDIELFACNPPCSMYTQPHHFGTNDLMSRLGAISTGTNALAVCQKDGAREGLMIGGPYIFLQKGRYLFKMSGAATDVDLNAKRCARLRLKRVGYSPAIEKEIGMKDLVGGNYEIALEFLVERDSPDWEFQVYYWPTSNFWIYRITLVRIGSN